MRRILVLAAVLAAAVSAEPRKYSLRPSPEARMDLRVSKTGFFRGKQHLFVFEDYQGTLRYDPQRPEASEVRLVLQARSLVCKDTWVSAKDLKKIQEFALTEMLAAEEHPEIIFASSGIRQSEGGKFEAQGTLTIRGIARPSTVLVSVMPRPNGALWLTGNAQVRHTDYGLKPASAALGTIGTRNEMAFSFSIAAMPE